MTVIDVGEAPILVGMRPPEVRPKRPPRGNGPDNPFANVPLAVYEQPIWRQPNPFMRGWVVNDPTALKRVLIDNVANYPKMDTENRFFRAAFGDGLLSREGDPWRAHRRIMAPSFDPRSVAGYGKAMADASAEFGDAWAKLGDGAEVDVSAEMTRLTLEIICRTAFSGDAAEMVELTGSTFHQATNAFDFSLLDLVPIISSIRMKRRERQFGQLFSRLDGALHRLIEQRRANPGKLDLLGRLVAAMDEETGAKLSTQEVRDEVLTIFVAGHETTASAMTFIWYVLSHYSAWEARLHAELAEVLGGRTPTEADVPKLQVTRRIVEETMRLYPPAPGLSGRVAKQADELCGVRIPKGGLIGISSWVLHRHRTLWDDPETFDPDRFLPERSAGRPRFAYLPFGGGPRVCIGQMMAMQEAILILATLAQRFRLRLRPGYPVVIQQQVTIRPRNGLPMTLERR